MSLDSFRPLPRIDDREKGATDVQCFLVAPQVVADLVLDGDPDLLDRLLGSVADLLNAPADEEGACRPRQLELSSAGDLPRPARRCIEAKDYHVSLVPPRRLGA